MINTLKHAPSQAGMIKLQLFNIKSGRSGDVTIAQQAVDQTEWLVGRADDCYLCLEDPKVSRNHARIRLIEGSFYFSDLNSRWGSVVNGRELHSNQVQLIQEGDTILLGDTVLYIKEVLQTDNTHQLRDNSDRTPQPSEYWSDGDIMARCFRIVEETPDCKTFWLTGDPPTLFYYLPGQFINLELEIDGQIIRRPYSISSSPSRPYALGITVKRVCHLSNDPDLPPGLVSNWLHDHVQVGSTLKIVGGAMGNFTCLPDLPPKLLFIGAGSGITPLMSMCRWFYDTASEADIHLINSVRTPKDIIFRAELDQMSAQMPNFKLAHTVTRPHLGQPWSGLTQHVSSELLKMLAPDLRDRYVFCCGPDDFMQTVQRSLEQLQFPMEHYKQESFGGKRKPKQSQQEAVASPPTSLGVTTSFSTTTHRDVQSPPTQIGNGIGRQLNGKGTTSATAASQAVTQMKSAPAAAPNPPITIGSPQITFTKSNQVVEIDSESSLLETAEQSGIKINNACRQGACGACKVRVQGQVEHEGVASALTEDDRKKGYVLSCIAYAKGATSVEA